MAQDSRHMALIYLQVGNDDEQIPCMVPWRHVRTLEACPALVGVRPALPNLNFPVGDFARPFLCPVVAARDRLLDPPDCKPISETTRTWQLFVRSQFPHTAQEGEPEPPSARPSKKRKTM